MHPRARQLTCSLVATVLVAALVPFPAFGVASPRRVRPYRASSSTMRTGASAERVLVRFRDPSAGAVRGTLSRNALASSSAVVPKRGPAVVRVPKGKTRDALLAELSRDANVAYAEPVYYRSITAYVPPNDPEYNDTTGWTNGETSIPSGSSGKSWWLRGNGLNAPSAWMHGFSEPAGHDFPVRAGGSAFKVGVIDTGFFMTHPDRGANIVAGHDFFQSETGGHYVEDEDVTPPTTNEIGVAAHGTCTAGQVAAATSNGVGVASVGYDAQVRVYKVAGVDVDGGDGAARGEITIPNDRMIAAIYRATDEGCRVISISLGGPDSSQAEQDAIDYAWDHGVVVVAATGNDADPAALYPARYLNVVGVGSYGYANGSRMRSSFSNHGPGLDILAPGDLVWNLTKPTYVQEGAEGPAGYMFWSGTSMATPAAAGAIAHLWRYVPALTNAQVVDLVQSSAMPAGSGRPNGDYGWGYMDVSRAMTKVMADYPYLSAPAIDLPSTTYAGMHTVAWDPVAGADVVYDVNVDGTRIGTTTGLNLAVPLRVGEHTVTVQATSLKNYYDASSTASLTVHSDPVPGATPTDSWGGMQPTTLTRYNPTVSVEAKDATSGLLPGEAEFRYSEDGGDSWSDWSPAGLSCPPFTTETQTVSATVPFLTDSDTQNLAQFRVTNGSDMIGLSPTLTVQVDGTKPAGEVRMAGGATSVTTHTVSVTSAVTDAHGVEEMRLSRDGGAHWTQWQPFSQETTITLRRGRGERTLLAEYSDPVDNVRTLADTVTVDVPVSVERVSGPSRYDTAIEISKQHFDSADTVIIATGQNFADALAASALAGSYDAPLLLTPTASLWPNIPAEVQRLGAKHAIVVGGDPAVSSATYDELVALTQVTARRVSGPDRYATAAAIALEVAAHEQALDRPMPSEYFLARGDGYADALAASPLAYARRIPILLTRTTAIPTSTWQAIWSLAPAPASKKAIVLGSTSAVGKAVTDELALNHRPWERVEGPGRYDTAVAVAEYGVGHGWANWGFAGVATGENFPDALGGGIAAGARGGVILLTRTSTPVPQCIDTLTEHEAQTGAVEAFGGPPAVSGTVVTALADIYR